VFSLYESREAANFNSAFILLFSQESTSERERERDIERERESTRFDENLLSQLLRIKMYYVLGTTFFSPSTGLTAGLFIYQKKE
jgi:hypothetical protein